MRVRAIARGYYGGSLRQVGDVFEAEGKAAWFVPDDGNAQPDQAQAATPRKTSAASKTQQ